MICFGSCLIVRHPCSHKKGDAALVKSLLLQVIIQKPRWFPLVALPLVYQFSCPLLFLCSYPLRYFSFLLLLLFLQFVLFIFNRLSTTFKYMCKALLLPIYHATVNYYPLIVLLATHLSIFIYFVSFSFQRLCKKIIPLQCRFNTAISCPQQYQVYYFRHSSGVLVRQDASG